MHGGSGGWPSMFSMMTMEIDRPWQLAHNLGESEDLLSRNAVMAEGDVGIA